LSLTLVHRTSSWDFDLQNYDFANVDSFLPENEPWDSRIDFPDVGMTDAEFGMIDFPDIELSDSVVTYSEFQDTEILDLDMFLDERFPSSPIDICYGAVSFESFISPSRHSNTHIHHHCPALLVFGPWLMMESAMRCQG
jgi:hypothetical protein